MAPSEDNGQPRSITVSRDALRAELAEMELRLRTWIDSKLHEKADAVEVAKLAAEISLIQRTMLTREGPVVKSLEKYTTIVDKIETGEFNRAQTKAIEVIVDTTLEEKSTTTWTARERRFALVGLIIAGVSLLSTLLLTAHYLGAF